MSLHDEDDVARRSERARGLPAALADAMVGLGAVLAAFLITLVVETIFVTIAHKRLFAGGWETRAIRWYVMPVAFGFFVPTAVAMRLLGALGARAAREPVARRLAATLAFTFAAAVAWGVSEGRHFARPPVRLGFALTLSVAAAAGAFVVIPRLAAAPPRIRALLGIAIAIAAWWADAFVLPHLYPAFHSALFLVTLGGAALAASALDLRGRVARGVTLGAILASGAALGFAKTAATKLASYDNVRLVLVERAPILGRAVRLAATLAPRARDTAPEGEVSFDTAPDAREGLDFRGRDVLFVSIDALRADHVGAYGYARPTTPNIDRLAKGGVRFDAAYCPTPHASYSVTSMMTGKYMRPLLALGVGEDSDTWAGILRQYGYRTAAFYPPAVFFIDEARFTAFRDRGLDFEYRKVEFAAPELRVKQVDDYLARAPQSSPVFLWVHLFEPHEPYVMHPEHPFGDPSAPKPMDAYDSEIAAADAALGTIVDHVRRQRPHVVTIVAADHGEEFGEHGGRYHGTSVYDEQVRVPLVMHAEGVPSGVVGQPVQTIDILPTVLAALKIPRPARVRGRDLGPIVRGGEKPGDRGFAFAETEDATLVAEGDQRLVCERHVMACALYEPKTDPGEVRDNGPAHADVVARLKAKGAELARSHGRFEHGRSADYPEALRRALQGDAEAALEIAPLLDDVRLDIRRAAARALFELHVADTAPFAERALAAGGDSEVERYAALALVRMRVASRPPAASTIADELLARGDGDWRFRASLALGESGDARGGPVLATTLDASLGKSEGASSLSFAEQRDVVRVLGVLKERTAVRALVKALDDVRLRPLAADALGAIGDPSARAPLLAAFEHERYVSMRGAEARALVALGAGRTLESPLRAFAGVPEPWPDAARIALAAGVVAREKSPRETVSVPAAPSKSPRRLYVLSTSAKGDDGGAGDAVAVKIGSGPLAPIAVEGDVSVFTLPAGEGALVSAEGAAARIAGTWVVDLTAELPPPAPVPWDAGAHQGGSTDGEIP